MALKRIEAIEGFLACSLLDEENLLLLRQNWIVLAWSRRGACGVLWPIGGLSRQALARTRQWQLKRLLLVLRFQLNIYLFKLFPALVLAGQLGG